MKTGVLFDSCPLQKANDKMRPPYRVGSLLHSLVYSLPPDPVIDNYDSYNDWFISFVPLTHREERFTTLLSSLQQDYHSKYSQSLLFIIRFFTPPPMCINQHGGSNYSSLRVSYSSPHTSYIMEADDICYLQPIDSLVFSDFRSERLNKRRYANYDFPNSAIENDGTSPLPLSHRFRMGMEIQIFLWSHVSWSGTKRWK